MLLIGLKIKLLPKYLLDLLKVRANLFLKLHAIIKKKIFVKLNGFAGKDNDFSNNVPQFSGAYQININPPDATPYPFFNQIFTNYIFEHIKEETIRYAIQSGKDNFKLTTQELKIFFALNIAMTYIKYPNVRMYWSSLPGMRIDLIANNMTK